MNLATQRLCWKMLECSNWQQLKWVNTLNGAYPLQTYYRGIVFFRPSWLWSTRVIVILNSQSGMNKLPQPQRSHVLHAKCSTAKPSNAVTLQQGRQIVLISLDWAFKKMSTRYINPIFPPVILLLGLILLYPFSECWFYLNHIAWHSPFSPNKGYCGWVKQHCWSSYLPCPHDCSRAHQQGNTPASESYFT